jgi:hypothetical protein
MQSMETAGHISNPDRPSTYQIIVQGGLDSSWSDWFNGMTISRAGEFDGDPTTILTGPVADQPALRGLLARIWDLNLILISVKRIDTGDEHHPTFQEDSD